MKTTRLTIASAVLLAATASTSIAGLLPPPGSGTGIIPDPRPPAGSCPCPPPAAQPLSFVAALTDYEKFAQTIASLSAWFQTLPPDQQNRERAAYQGQLDKLDAKAQVVCDRINAQLDAGQDGDLYYLFQLIRLVDPVRARAIWLPVLDKACARVNADYLADPSNPEKTRRARDSQAVRTYVGFSSTPASGPAPAPSPAPTPSPTPAPGAH